MDEPILWGTAQCWSVAQICGIGMFEQRPGWSNTSFIERISGSLELVADFVVCYKPKGTNATLRSARIMWLLQLSTQCSVTICT